MLIQKLIQRNYKMENKNTTVVEKPVIEKVKLTETEMKKKLDEANTDIETLISEIEEVETTLLTKRQLLADKQSEIRDVAKKWIATQNKKYGLDEPKVRKSGGGRPKKVVDTTTTTDTTK
jgi:DNA-directed RNA polymerase beta' subunit